MLINTESWSSLWDTRLKILQNMNRPYQNWIRLLSGLVVRKRLAIPSDPTWGVFMGLTLTPETCCSLPKCLVVPRSSRSFTTQPIQSQPYRILCTLDLQAAQPMTMNTRLVFMVIGATLWALNSKLASPLTMLNHLLPIFIYFLLFFGSLHQLLDARSLFLINSG